MGSSESLVELSKRSGFFFRELRRYPSAIFGLTIIILMFIGSIYAVTALPYEEFGRAYDVNRVSGQNLVPRLAVPKWLNGWSIPPRLSTLILNENSPQTIISARTLENGWVEKTTTFKFDYAYREIPSDVFLYLDSQYAQKLPFVSLTWKTPDGRSINLKAKLVRGNLNYDFESGFSVSQLLNQNPKWKKWFVYDGQYPTPAYQLLFARPGSTEPTPLTGTYQLEVKSLLYIEMARSYGASNSRIIINYLVPRILPVLIPQLVALVPSFIFLEATLGLFNIKSDYPSWGRIIYEGLARGALYGSPFWVLEPIFLLLLTGFAFAMLGSALERILNPRIIADIPLAAPKATIRQPTPGRANFNKRVIAIAIVMVLFGTIFVPSTPGKTLARVIFNFVDQKLKYDPRITKPSGPIFTRTPDLSSTPASTALAAAPTASVSTFAPIPALPSTSTATVAEATLTASPMSSRPMTYTAFTSKETLYTIACQFGDIDPATIAEANHLSVDSALSIGQQLNIP